MAPTRASTSSPSPQQPSPNTPSTMGPLATATATPTPQTEYSTMTPIAALRRKNSLGPLRRAHPASGATWNVEVIRGKMTSRCLWHACRALVLGMVLMVLGAGMATIGYYAVPLSAGQVERNSTTTFIKNISRGYHLNNLSYIGPIVMGFGGFIVVAACVMTFEARDSAAKVVPARFKLSSVGGVAGAGNPFGGSGRTRNSSGIRRSATGAPNGPSSVGSQTNTARWDREMARDNAAGPFRASSSDKNQDRQALTAALIHFSRALGTPGQSPSQSRRISRVSHSGSVPNLHGESSSVICVSQSPNKHQCPFAAKCVGVANGSGSTRYHHHHGNHSHRKPSHGGSSSGHHRRSSSRHSSLTQRHTRERQAERFLHPAMLKYHRHAVSVDESLPPPCLRPILTNSHHDVGSGSQPTISSSPTHDVMRHIKRSDTARQHVLARQRNIEKEDNNNGGIHSPKAINSYYSSFSGSGGGRRRSSTASDASMASRNTACARRGSTVSRTPSIDSRGVISSYVPGAGQGGGCEAVHSSVEGITQAPSCDVRQGIIAHTASSSSPRSWRVSAQISTPSVEKEFRSQLSICSEPAIATTSSPKALSCQSSIEPCVPEEGSPEADHKSIEGDAATTIIQRPDTLILECSPLSHPERLPSKYLTNAQKSSTSSFKRKRSRKAGPENASVSEIYFISSAATTEKEPNQDYDSIEVIDERRNKSFGQKALTGNCSSSGSSYCAGNATTSGTTNITNLERTDTVIYRDLKDTSSQSNVQAQERIEEKEDEEDNRTTMATNVTTSSTTMTIMAEIEQRRSSNTDTDNSDVR